MSEPTIPIPFAIGEQLWYAGTNPYDEHVTCPECNGDKVLTIIKGNGEQVSVECGYCNWGMEPARGWIVVHHPDYRPIRFVAGRVSVDGDKIRYSDASCYGSVDVDRLFRNELDCAKRCVELNEERAEQAAEREVHNLASKHKSLAWSVSYWGREVKDLERKLEVARGRLNVCKEKAKVRVCAADKAEGVTA